MTTPEKRRVDKRLSLGQRISRIEKVLNLSPQYKSESVDRGCSAPRPDSPLDPPATQQLEEERKRADQEKRRAEAAEKRASDAERNSAGLKKQLGSCRQELSLQYCDLKEEQKRREEAERERDDLRDKVEQARKEEREECERIAFRKRADLNEVADSEGEVMAAVHDFASHAVLDVERAIRARGEEGGNEID